jgi:hypothetical protein
MRVGKRLFGYFRSGQVKMAGPHSLYEFIRESPVRSLYLQIQYGMRADERTRATFLLQLRVISQWLQGFARTCKSRISKPYSLLCLAECCTVLRSRWYQSGIDRDIAASRSCSLVALI